MEDFYFSKRTIYFYFLSPTLSLPSPPSNTPATFPRGESARRVVGGRE